MVDVDVAMRAHRGRTMLASGRDVDVVLLASQSEETLRPTHSSFFREGGDLSRVLPIAAG